MDLNQSQNLGRVQPGTIANKLFVFVTYVLAAFPVLSFGTRSVVIIIWVLFGLICSNVNRAEVRKSIDSRSIQNLVIFLLPFLVLVFSLSYSEDLEQGLKKITQMLSLAIFPLVFFFNRNVFSKQINQNVVLVFCTSVVIFVFYEYILVGLNFEELFANLSEREIKRNNLHHLSVISDDQINQVKLRRLRSFIQQKVDTHPTYQGLWISFTLFFLVQKIRKNRDKIFLFSSYIIVFGVLSYWMVFLSARGPIVATLFAFLLSMLLFFRLRKRTYVLILLGVFAGLTACYSFMKPFQTRVDEVLQNLFQLPTTDNDIYNFNSTNVRTGIYYCGFSIAKENFISGVGVGDAQSILTTCYQEKIGAKIYTWHTFNSHNQYLFFVISCGIFGLITFLFLLLHGIRTAYTTSQARLFYFLILISLTMLTENVISRSDGILFFSLFFNIAMFGHKEVVEK